jgi:hypothetical protein
MAWNGRFLVIGFAAGECLLHEQTPGTLEKRAPIGDPAQRIDHGVDLVLQLGAFIGHVEQQEGHDDGEEQRAECKQRERDRSAMSRRRTSGKGGRDLREQHGRVGQRTTVGQREAAARSAAPQLLGGGRGQHGRYRANHHDAQVGIALECRTGRRTAKPPARRKPRGQHLAAVEIPRPGPGEP